MNTVRETKCNQSLFHLLAFIIRARFFLCIMYDHKIYCPFSVCFLNFCSQFYRRKHYHERGDVVFALFKAVQLLRYACFDDRK